MTVTFLQDAVQNKLLEAALEKIELENGSTIKEQFDIWGLNHVQGITSNKTGEKTLTLQMNDFSSYTSAEWYGDDANQEVKIKNVNGKLVMKLIKVSEGNYVVRGAFNRN